MLTDFCLLAPSSPPTPTAARSPGLFLAADLPSSHLRLDRSNQACPVDCWGTSTLTRKSSLSKHESRSLVRPPAPPLPPSVDGQSLTSDSSSSSSPFVVDSLTVGRSARSIDSHVATTTTRADRFRSPFLPSGVARAALPAAVPTDGQRFSLALLELLLRQQEPPSLNQPAVERRTSSSLQPAGRVPSARLVGQE